MGGGGVGGGAGGCKVGGVWGRRVSDFFSKNPNLHKGEKGGGWGSGRLVCK